MLNRIKRCNKRIASSIQAKKVNQTANYKQCILTTNTFLKFKLCTIRF
jgi:hypothetical protein